MTGLAGLTTSGAWTRMLHVAARFDTYSGGAVRVFDRSEYSGAGASIGFAYGSSSPSGTAFVSDSALAMSEAL